MIVDSVVAQFTSCSTEALDAGADTFLHRYVYLVTLSQ